jgi:hypothetical protein
MEYVPKEYRNRDKSSQGGGEKIPSHRSGLGGRVRTHASPLVDRNPPPIQLTLLIHCVERTRTRLFPPSET